MKKRGGGGGVVTAPSGSRKRAASEAAAHVTYEEISSLFGLSLAQAAARIGVRATIPPPPRTPPYLRPLHLHPFPLCTVVVVGVRPCGRGGGGAWG